MSDRISIESEAEFRWNQFSPPVQTQSRIIMEDGASLPQALLAAVLTATVREYRQRSVSRQLGRIIAWGLALPIVALSAYVIVALCRIGLDQLQVPFVDELLMGIAALMVLVALASRIGTADHRIRLAGSPQVTRLSLGRCEAATDVSRLVTCLILTAILFGTQAGLLQFAEIGLGQRYSFIDSLLLTVDNYFHGVVLDICELFELRVGPEWEHHAQSSTVFLSFRIAFDVVVGVAVYVWYRNTEVQQMLCQCPHEITRRKELCLWIDNVMRDRRNWMREFGAECVFLQMVRVYLEDRLTDAIELERILPAVQIDPQVRQLFHDSHYGNPVPTS